MKPVVGCASFRCYPRQFVLEKGGIGPGWVSWPCPECAKEGFHGVMTERAVVYRRPGRVRNRSAIASRETGT